MRKVKYKEDINGGNIMEYKTIDEYISSCPKEHQERLNNLRKFISKHLPNATERMSWQMPTFYQKENIIHFCLHKNHIGLYPGAEAVECFKSKLENYKTSKGAVQLPLNQELPYNLIEDILEFRLKCIEK